MASAVHGVGPPQTAVMNGSCWDEEKILDTVKVCTHLVGFIATTVFSYVIVMTVYGKEELRQKIHYVLLCQHSICIAGFNAFGSLLHAMRALHTPAPIIVCWVVFDVQVVLARGLMVTLTLMCLNTCLSVCRPLQYWDIIHAVKHKLLLVMWALALFNPVLFTALAYAEAPRGYITKPDPACPTTLDGWASRISAIALLILLISLIFTSYVLIYWEGRRAGHFLQSNTKGRRTILIHGLQMSLHILPTIVIISGLSRCLAISVVNFLVFSLSQILSPIVYGLRCQEIWNQVPRFVPHWAQLCRQRVDASDHTDGSNCDLAATTKEHILA